MSSSIDLLEVAYVGALFGGYFVLWRTKRVLQRRRTGVDPEVMARSRRPLQVYFARLLRVMTAALAVLIVGHALVRSWPGFVRVPALDTRWADHLGFGLGLLGLLFCLLAQLTLGSAWRVGIDEERQTPLVQSGIYAHIRNPTYLGLFLMNAGLWLIWPTASIGTFALVFFVVMEVQVRCEEEHLEAAHGDAFRAYKARTRRYLPGIY